jgi:predicted CXXCH cytochrome family protein
MKRQAQTILFIIFIMTTVGRTEQSSCIKCHISSDNVGDTTIAASFLNGDIHNRNGIDCSDCHGGNPRTGFKEQDPSLAMDPAKGYKIPPLRNQVPGFCARCHSDIEYMKKYNPKLPTDQFQLYKTSGHGKALYQNGDTLVAVCTDCHGVHGLLPPSDSRSPIYHNNIPGTCNRCHGDASRMKAYSNKSKAFPTNQYELYSQSVHGIMVLQKDDKSAPACNNCHGNHGASPPNLASVSAACGECHANNRDFFNQSPHKIIWQQQGLPECEQCHSNHLIKTATDQMLGIGDSSLCVECHVKGSSGYQIALRLKASVDSLKVAVASAENIIGEAEQKGAMGSEARYNLGPIKDALTRVRSVMHTSDTSKVDEIVKPALANAKDVAITARLALKDMKMRQIGLGISLLLVLFIVYALYRKIKLVDNKQSFIVKK